MAAVNALPPTDDEADTDLYLPKKKQRKDKRSKLIRSFEARGGRANSGSGLTVNACPFGCPDDSLDENELCRHMIGTTVPGDDKHFYPVKVRKNRKGGSTGFKFTDGTDLQEVQPGDHLVRITTASRVYRNDSGPAGPSQEEQDDAE